MQDLKAVAEKVVVARSAEETRAKVASREDSVAMKGGHPMDPAGDAMLTGANPLV